MSLNPAQTRAVQHRGSGLLVLAGAGTGKTRVITHRIQSLVKEGTNPKQILAVTFTNKAAKEMRERLEKMGVPEGVWIGTFHAVGLRILRMHGELVGYQKNFTIYDDDAQKSLVKALLADADTGGKKFHEGVLRHYIQGMKGKNLGPDEVGREESEVPAAMRRLVEEVYRRYEEALRRSNAMDFADLLLNTVRLLHAAHDTPAQWLTSRFKHVLVDEFQDTNKIQMDMVDLLSQEGELCVVGDDDQAIYGWRGANPKGMIEFSRRPKVELVKLEENYRCTSSILDCANAVIAQNGGRIGKVLRTQKNGDLVRVTLVSDDRMEAESVASAIQKPWSDHAILYRTHAQSRPLEETFRRRGIPYTIVGGLRFYDRAEVKDLMAYFRLAVNPKADMDLLRVANRPARGMGLKKMGALKTQAAQKSVCMFEALQDTEDPRSKDLRAMIEALASAKGSSFSLLDFFDEVMQLTGYRNALVATAKGSKSHVQREKAEARIENVDELASDLASYSQDCPGATVEDYLEHVALVSSFDKETGDDAVSLMTVHAAKGLEFPHVHLVGFEERLLPHANSIAEEEKGDSSPLEEERRLAYVAITRAKEHLDITLARMRTRAGRPERAVPSRFLDEMPQGRYRRLGFKP